MNRQSVTKAQKPKNSTLLPATGILQRKGINRTDFGPSTVDTRSPSEQQADKLSLPSAESHFNYDFSKIAVRLNSPCPIQAKLKIGQPDDKYEQEADRVAEQVMRMPEPRLSSSVGDSSLANSKVPHSGTIQRACATCSEDYKTAENEYRPVEPANLCPNCRTQEGLIQTKQITPLIQRQESLTEKEEEEDEELIQAKTTGGVTPEVTPAISSGIQSLQGGGRPLSGSERSFFEPRFGADFSSVRVHNDTRAASAARSVNARAFTLGHNVVFGAGEYSPDALVGRKLLAHELTHVVQQRSAPAGTPTTVMREVTARGFFANLFKADDYEKETLDQYLRDLADKNQIIGDDDSDDMARQIVEEWKADKSRYSLEPEIRVLMVREMLDGHVGDSDQEGIIDLLEGSINSELKVMFRTSSARLTLAEILPEFDTYKKQLELFNESVLKNLERYKTPDPERDKSIGGMLKNVEKEHGIVFNDFSLSIQVAAGTLYESFWVDFVLPFRTTVTITLTPSQLSINFEPSVFVDLPWFVENAQLSKFVLRFDGLQANLDVEGWDVVSDFANENLQKNIDELLAGTRFSDPKYNPTEDPHLIAEIVDQEVIGDLDRVKYNFEKNLSRKEEAGEEDSKHAESVSDPSIRLNLTHKTGTRLGDDKWGIKIEPGTKFSLRAQAHGTGSEMIKKKARLGQVSIDSDGIFIMRGEEAIARLKSVHMNPGMEISLGGVRWLRPVKEILKEEFPNEEEFFGTIADLAVDASDLDNQWEDFKTNVETLWGVLEDPKPKSDSLGDVSIALSEWLISYIAWVILENNSSKIQEALGITKEQLYGFFGLSSPSSKKSTGTKK